MAGAEETCQEVARRLPSIATRQRQDEPSAQRSLGDLQQGVTSIRQEVEGNGWGGGEVPPLVTRERSPPSGTPGERVWIGLGHCRLRDRKRGRVRLLVWSQRSQGAPAQGPPSRVQRDSLSEIRTPALRLRSLRRRNGRESLVSLTEQDACAISGQSPLPSSHNKGRRASVASSAQLSFDACLSRDS